MKKIYLKPELEVYNTRVECMMITDSKGNIAYDDIGAKENNDFFDMDEDQFGDTWGVDSNNLWGDEE